MIVALMLELLVTVYYIASAGNIDGDFNFTLQLQSIGCSV